MNKYQKGFTLIELLVVIGIIAVLIGVFVTTVNLSRPFQQARDSQRSANVNAIAAGIKQRIADNRGSWNAAATAGCADLPQAPGEQLASISDAGFDLAACLVPRYMSAIPVDPSTGVYTSSTSYEADYMVLRRADGRIQVQAPNCESELCDAGTFIEVIN